MSEPPREPPPGAPPRGGVGPGVRAAATVLLVLVASCLGSLLVSWIRQAVAPAPPPAEVLEVRPTPSVVVAVRELSRLETTSFHMERVIDMTSTQRRLFGLVEAEDSILLVAAADVVAGVDLSGLTDDDVEIRGERVTITVPEPEIFTVALDNERTYVHRRDTDALAQRSASLETRARREAERTLREAAVEAGIEDRARAGAERSLGSLIRSLGYEDVEVRFRSDAP